MKPRLIAMLFVTALLIAGCSSYHDKGDQPPTLESRAQTTQAEFMRRDPTIGSFIENAWGYAIYPEVAQGAAGIGGAHGDGVVYEQHKVIGTTGLSQASIGAQLGGQIYSEIVFFKDKPHLDEFKAGNVEFSAKASAVAASKGAAAQADYTNGVAVFTMPKTGLMFEAAIGGQKFSYEPRK